SKGGVPIGHELRTTNYGLRTTDYGLRTVWSLALKIRRSLLEERQHPFAVIRGRTGGVLSKRLGLELCVKVRIEGTVEEAFHRADGLGGQVRQSCSEFLRHLHQLVGGNDPIYQAQVESIRCRNLVSGETQLQRLAQAH